MEPVPQKTLNWLYGILSSVPHFQCHKDQICAINTIYRITRATEILIGRTQMLRKHYLIIPPFLHEQMCIVWTTTSHLELTCSISWYGVAYEHGQSALLLNLVGTLPVNFRGTTYMFPLSIWIPHEYPRAVPIHFVTPTRNMAVRSGQYVSGEGRIYHPYLAGWREDVSEC